MKALLCLSIVVGLICLSHLKLLRREKHWCRACDVEMAIIYAATIFFSCLATHFFIKGV